MASFLFLRPRPVRGGGSRPDPRPAIPELVCHTFDGEATAGIVGSARARNATTNDLFLSALFVALARWNDPGTGASARGGRLRIMIPTNLRTRATAESSAANLLGFAFMDRHPSECAHGDTLLRGVSREMRTVLRARRGRVFLDGLAVADQVPGVLRLGTRIPLSFATVAFSNLDGFSPHPPRKDGSPLPRMVSLACATPLRPGTRASFFLTRNGARLTLALRTDPRHFSHAAAGRLLGTVVEEVERLREPSLLDPPDQARDQRAG